MQKRTFIVLLLLTTLAAMAATWCWALPPLLTSVIYPHPTDWTQADVIRHIWHFRLVQPEWVSTPPDYLRWSQAETLARLIVVFLAWVATTCFLVRRYVIGHRDTPPNQITANMWFPFESPESRAIRENLQPEEWERLRGEGERAGHAAANQIIAPLVVVSVLGAVFYPWGLLFGPSWLLIMVFTGRHQRQEAARRSIQILCETEYARAHGITPQTFRSYRFPWTK